MKSSHKLHTAVGTRESDTNKKISSKSKAYEELTIVAVGTQGGKVSDDQHKKRFSLSQLLSICQRHQDIPGLK